MVLKSEIQKSFLLQQQQFFAQKVDINRRDESLYKSSTNQVEVITGVRRCGKSTLLRQLMQPYEKVAFFNFEDPRIFGFEVQDFSKLDEIMGTNLDAYFFDEIQNVPSWELFIRQLHDRKQKVFITGSNASLLSKELGTRLTGRHLRKELYPFSYQEFLDFTKQASSENTFSEYLTKGGFPEAIKYQNIEILQNLIKDIVFRDIAIRHSIRNTNLLMDVTLHLLSNIGKETSFNSLRKMFGIGSANTVSDYLNWLEDAYLLFLVPRFSWSAKSTMINPKKVYAIDNGLATANTLSFSTDNGRMLENAVFLFLKQHHEQVYYFKESKECDFIVFDHKKCNAVIQVCYDLHPDNQDREIQGLQEAMLSFNLKLGYIITFNQEDAFKMKDNTTIKVVPAHQFMIDYKM
jgi:predicted AAA+ superfamily ATPase